MSTFDARCPQCGALLRSDAAWCTLCHTDLRPAPAPELVHAPEQLPPPVAAAPAAPVAGLPPVPAVDPLSSPLDQVIAAALAEQEAEQRAALAGEPLDPAALVVDPADPAATAGGTQAQADSLAGINDPDVMFALLRGESQDPLLARFGGRFDEPLTRITVIVGGALLLTAALFGAATLFGLLFG